MPSTYASSPTFGLTLDLRNLPIDSTLQRRAKGRARRPAPLLCAAARAESGMQCRSVGVQRKAPKKKHSLYNYIIKLV
jgi:hypothetical protein